mmetsp:Transcript_28814/g.44259  ORF Transcript_28814/g.44259 Transcript_28814/m.44259 type:complete len:84 (+) Transcript_28814:675-926(+)
MVPYDASVSAANITPPAYFTPRTEVPVTTGLVVRSDTDGIRDATKGDPPLPKDSDIVHSKIKQRNVMMVPNFQCERQRKQQTR